MCPLPRRSSAGQPRRLSLRNPRWGENGYSHWGTALVDSVSKLERRADMCVSTLQDFVRALGGELKITAKFPEGTVEIRQFGERGAGKE